MAQSEGSLAAIWAALITPAKKTYFMGEAIHAMQSPGTWVTDGSKLYISGAVLTGQDAASDPRVSGELTLGLDAIWDAAGSTGPMWGKLQLANHEGEWNGYWKGTKTLSGPNAVSSFVGTAVGSGAYKGLLARWTCSGMNVEETHQLSVHGFIVEATGRPDFIPLQMTATRTERVKVHSGWIITPPAKPPYAESLVATVDIVDEVAQVAYLGRAENVGTGLILPNTETFSGCGTAVTAYGGEIHWVVLGKVAFETGIFEASVKINLAGGTGRFEAACGEITAAVSAPIESTEDPSVFLVTFSYPASGLIKF